jgi:hypothetical protein
MAEKCAVQTCRPDARDWTGSPRLVWLLWKLPWLVVILGAFCSPTPRALLWGAAFTVAGVGCLANALRCGRRHCFYTGPWYLAAAGATLGYASGGPRPSSWGWWLLVCGTWVGVRVLCLVSERRWGMYRARSHPDTA